MDFWSAVHIQGARDRNLEYEYFNFQLPGIRLVVFDGSPNAYWPLQARTVLYIFPRYGGGFYQLPGLRCFRYH